MADNVTSGNEGYVTLGSSDVCNLSSWDATLDQAINETVTHCSSPWVITARGNKKVTGNIRAKWDDQIRLENLAVTDALVALQLIMKSGKYLAGNARLGAISHSVNVETGAIQEVSVAFVSDGSWSYT